MTGHIEKVRSPARAIRITKQFMQKFPFTKDLFKNGVQSKPDLKNRVHLFGFRPVQAFMVDNQTAFGRRIEVDPSTFEPL